MRRNLTGNNVLESILVFQDNLSVLMIEKMVRIWVEMLGFRNVGTWGTEIRVQYEVLVSWKVSVPVSWNWVMWAFTDLRQEFWSGDSEFEKYSWTKSLRDVGSRSRGCTSAKMSTCKVQFEAWNFPVFSGCLIWKSLKVTLAGFRRIHTNLTIRLILVFVLVCEFYNFQETLELKYWQRTKLSEKTWDVDSVQMQIFQ